MYIVKVTWHTAKYGDPYSEFMLCIFPSRVHTYSSEHTHCAVGSSCGFGALLKGTSVMVLSVERALDIHSPPPTIPAGPETRTHNLWITSPTL